MYTPESAPVDTFDARDPLAPFLERFVPAPTGIVYLDGNSLGRPPRATRAAILRTLDEEWPHELIRGWAGGWLELPTTVGDELAAAALGAAPGQTALADSTTVNLHKCAAAALAARPGRSQILTDRGNFPTDRYVLEGLAHERGLVIDWLETPPEGGPTPRAVAAHLSEDTALVCFGHVDYRSGHLAELGAITRLAHDAGALVLWDLSHTAGVLPVALDDSGVDFAVGCTYKYLGGGPGAPAFLYAAHAHHDALHAAIPGWLGRRDPFAMADGYVPAGGVGTLLSGTPPILGLVAARAGIALTAEAGIGAIRAKSIALTAHAIALADELLARHGVRVLTPRDPERRGGHVALAHPQARVLTRRLADEHGVLVDFREPDVIRIGLAPLTTRFADVEAGLARLAELLRPGPRSARPR